MTKIPDIQRREYENGLVVLKEHLPDRKKASLVVGVRAGSVNEDKNSGGVAHFNEHMLFRSNSKQSAKGISRNLEHLGARSNAATNWINTIIYANTLSKSVPVVLKIFFEAINNFRFLKDEFEKEKQVIQSEMHKYQENPTQYLFNSLFIPTLFQETAVQKKVIGTKESIENMSIEKLKSFKKKYYIPNRMVITISGNFEDDKVNQILEKTFATLEKGGDIENPDIEMKNSFHEKVVEKPVNQAYFHSGIKVPGDKFRDTRSLVFLSNVLSAGSSSRLFLRLREETGLTYKCGSNIINVDGKAGALDTYAFYLDPEKIDKARNIIKNELRDLRQSLIPKPEFQKTKNLLLSAHWKNMKDLDARARRLVKQEFQGIKYDFRRLPEFLETLTPKKIREVAREYINLDQLTTTAIVPES